jgi:hypothetical protein
MTYVVQTASYPPLQKTQGRGTHGVFDGGEIRGRATRPEAGTSAIRLPPKKIYSFSLFPAASVSANISPPEPYQHSLLPNHL